MSASRALSALRHLDRSGEVLRALRLSASWPRLTAAYMGLPSRYPLELRTRGGDLLRLSNLEDVRTAWIIFCRLEYQVAPELLTIVDAGANIGLFSLYAARRAPRSRIVALEPFPSSFAALEQQLARNALTERVAARPWALGPHDGSARMESAPGLPSQKRSVRSQQGEGNAVLSTETEVPMLTLASVLEREGLERVDLLKIDVEGAEHAVFASTPREVLLRLGSIALEYHPNGSKQELFERILGASFELVLDVTFAPGNGVAHFSRR